MKVFPISPEPSKDVEREKAAGWRRLLREPLVHFLVVGAALFGGYHSLNPIPEGSVDGKEIVLTKDDVRQLAISWLAQGRSAPTVEQVEALVDQKVTQEILFREAINLGLDRDDEVVKRRLAQKMDFLAADVAALQEPTSAQLQTWFEANAASFALPGHASFRHLYFSSDRHGTTTRDAAAAALTLVAGKSPDEVGTVGDPFMFQNHYGDATPDQMAKEFGPDFSKALFQLTPGKWQGPVQSGYGWHLVWIDAIETGRVPTFAEVEPNIKAGWIDEQYRTIKASALEEMRAQYSIVVPDIEAGDLEGLQVPPGTNSEFEVSAQ
ncbi:peptidylprolyl isomerase [Pararhizobium sp. YC-54]|uniref:peptidylprolyl isomerase n=1 Tax=Pararhizobium sp. YC-54 TaxID=2986920 RepID=UPI0021F7960F|nr:peptidylprolyl isomerase [Pararhizobium sp. YC-54]MCW0000151.1 peptidylprolyl isomerase [Pararhizobium sp. YC-54]